MVSRPRESGSSQIGALTVSRRKGESVSASFKGLQSECGRTLDDLQGGETLAPCTVNIKVEVVRIRGGRVTLRITAPGNVQLWRGEIEPGRDAPPAAISLASNAIPYTASFS